MDRRAILAAVAALPLGACAPPRPAAPTDVRLDHLRAWTALEARTLLSLAGIEGIAPRHTVDAWRILYPSTDSAGRPTQLSGLLALPRAPAGGLVSWQHGTTTTRTAVPSRLSIDGLSAALVFAGTGRAVVAPDYVGLGDSALIHPYLVADDAARAVNDLLAAARQVAGVPKTPPFLAGFSQGGTASLAAHAALEAKGERVRASASVSGAQNLRTVSFPVALAGGSPNHPVYLAYLVRGYCACYGQPLESVLTPTAAAQVRDLFDTPRKPEEVMAGLPRRPRQMFSPGFLAAFDNNTANWLLDALAANETSHFTPKAPIRLYYGTADRDVVPAEAMQTAAEMQARGGEAFAVKVGDYDHDNVMLHAAPLIFRWLAELEGQGHA
ncbi:MAG: alpha/beta hydrolase [Phenylobacterium sp.]|uniref:alpha/beta hydrolase family protein n=1 Tax=Phenylobacterium sp. TaxID=1871053 RepID=UPI001A59C2CB|nr:lipase family protein [Phenylobacterium sp.]MBL8554710.1 alpha/beta hydrolase [Phenylobacterium sp.]